MKIPKIQFRKIAKDFILNALSVILNKVKDLWLEHKVCLAATLRWILRLTPQNDKIRWSLRAGKRSNLSFRNDRKKLVVMVIIAGLILSTAGVLTFFRPSTAHAAWYTTGGTWNYRQKITIAASKVGTINHTDQTDFPVLVKITDAGNAIFTSKAKNDGTDLLFTDSTETTALKYEIEKFDKGSHELDAWVKITSLSHTTDTIIYMYYGNASATTPAASVAQGVWGNGYAGVWHMGDATTSTIVDSTSNVNNGTKPDANNPIEATGNIGKAQSFNGVSSYIDIPNSTSTDLRSSYSVGVWFKITGTGTAGKLYWTLINKNDNGNGNLDPFHIYVQANTGTAPYSIGARVGNGSTLVSVADSTNLNDGLYHHVVLVFDDTNNLLNLYRDGILRNSQPFTYTLTYNSNKIRLGDWVGYGAFFKGIYDETRISSTARNADWISTEYANQNDPGTFFGLTAEEERETTPPTNPTVISGYSTSGKVTPITSGNYYNYPTPYFEWPAAEAAGGAHDTGTPVASGVAGYYSYFGTSCGGGGGDPAASHGTYLDDAGPTAGLHYSTSANITIPDLTTHEGTYCLRIKAADAAGNISGTTWEAYPSYKYDMSLPVAPAYIAVSPAGYTSTNSFDFSWPAASDTINAYASGVAGYQYERGGSSGDSWSTTIPAAAITGIASYQTGENIFLVRSVDAAGNVSSPVQTTYYYSADPPTKPTSLTADPTISDTNSFAFSWTAPVHARPIVSYGYVINAVPTISNLTWTGSDATTLAADAFATQQGVNTFYIVAKDDSGAYALDGANYATVSFNCTTVAPPIPTTVSVTDSSDQVLARYMLTLQWIAGVGQDGATFSHYSIERSTNGVDFAEIATTASTAYIDASALSNVTLYYYEIKAVDNAGSASAASTIVSKMPTGKFISPPLIVTEPTVSAQSTTATVSWVVNRTSIAAVRFSKSPTSLSESQLTTTTETDHAITLTGLQPSSTYYYQVQSLDALRDYTLESAYSTTYSFKTKVAPRIANVTVSDITLTSAVISWETTSASNTKVYYGASINYGAILPESDPSMTTSHSVKLTKLAHTTKYHFKIYGPDIDSNTLSSDDYVFETLEMPQISTIDTQTDFSGPTPALAISWLSNVPISSSIDYTPQGAGDTITYKESQSSLTLTHQVTLTNLLNDTEYRFNLSGADKFGNQAVSDLQVVKITGDIRPPQIFGVTIDSSNVGSGAINLAKVTVSWMTDEPATSQVAYDQGLAGASYKQKTPPDAGLTKTHMVVISGLVPGKPYHFQILSADSTGNVAYGEDRAVVTGQVAGSILNIITQTMNNLFGWIWKM